jgi:hypothetical protein
MKKISFKIVFFFFLFISYGQVVLAQTYTEKWQTAGDYTWTVPCGVTAFTVELWGAGGSGTSSNTGGIGGGGGYGKATFGTGSGIVVHITVGSAGKSNGASGSFGGGGPAGTPQSSGASGGGASFIFRENTLRTSMYALAGGGGASGRNLNAHGGGGGGFNSSGSNAPNNPTNSSITGGRGGSTSAGGGGGGGTGASTGGTGSIYSCTTCQSGGTGGNGSTNPVGGGGGGGYYGGGGGAGGSTTLLTSGGGGGSGYTNSTYGPYSISSANGSSSNGTPGNTSSPNYNGTAGKGNRTSGSDGLVVITYTVDTPYTVTAASSTPTLCQNTALTNITHTTTGATGIFGAGISGNNGLPPGVSANWSNNTITISGTPTTAGTFNYSILLADGISIETCKFAQGTITVVPSPTAGIASSSPTIDINTPLTAITQTTNNATGISDDGVSGANGLPAGVSASWASNLITISGTPTVAGSFPYTIPLTGVCGTINATGTIISRGVPVLSNFPALTKNYYDRSFSLNPPTSTSPGAFSYVSNNTAVATISGRTITFLSPGTATITANQDQTPFYQSAAISFPLTVNGVVVTSRSGAITSTDLNYASRSGALTGKKGKKRSGQIMVASTSAEIQTLTITNASSTTATATGSVISQGESTITARGFCWNTATNPTIENSTTSETGTTGALTSTITGLSSGTTYYFRAYTTNSSGTSYGNEISFTKP